MTSAAVGALRDKADVLAVGFVGDRERKLAREGPGFVLWQCTERKAQEIEFRAGGAAEEIALVAREIAGAMQFGPVRPGKAPRVMAGREGAGAEIARHAQEIAELDALVAADARDPARLAAPVAIGEILDHGGAKPRLVIEDSNGDAEALGDPRRVAHILPGAAGALFAGRRAVVVKLQGDADDVEPGGGEQRRSHRRIDPARHRDDNAVLGGVAREIDVGERRHRAAARPICQKSASSRAAVVNVAASAGKRPSPPRRANSSSRAAAAARARLWYSAPAYIWSHSR